MGSKNRIAKEILPIILKNRQKNQFYIEPFVGGANMIDKVDGNRIGADLNPYLIECLELIRDNVDLLPKSKLEFTEKDYNEQKFIKDSLYGYVGFALSYSGKWWGGWCRDSLGKRDYVAEAYKNALTQSEKLKGCIFIHSSYEKLIIPKNSIIYCDPPYEGTTKYNIKFDHKMFWDWCRLMKRDGHNIFISEYNAPNDFVCIFKKEIVSSLTKDTGSKKGIEKLFTI
ncbi:MAG: DNA adenine methylase [Patescibacteria group bacterium]|jgi:DNA adenine methylase